ncbi:MAG: flagellar assembly protein FliX [Pseudolabrys sp.]
MRFPEDDESLIALQGVEDPTERKKRTVVKGRNALDVLDTLKLSLLDGSVDPSTLTRLQVAAEGLTEETSDPGLNIVLSEIDLRVAVELAKAAVR